MPALDPFLQRIRLALFDQILESARPPSAGDLAVSLGLPRLELENALDELAAAKALVLRGDFEIAIVMPFSGAASDFVVKANGRRYFANSAWSALGIPAMLGVEAAIRAHCPDCGDEISFSIGAEGSRAVEPLLHFPLPAARFWGDPGMASSTIHFFKSHEHVDRWCEEHAAPRGAAVSLAAAWTLSVQWYQNHLSPEWRSKTPEEARAAFAAAGLTGAFWELS